MESHLGELKKAANLKKNQNHSVCETPCSWGGWGSNRVKVTGQ